MTATTIDARTEVHTPIPLPEHEPGEHYFKRQGGVWACTCGARRDRHGQDIQLESV